MNIIKPKYVVGDKVWIRQYDEGCYPDYWNEEMIKMSDSEAIVMRVYSTAKIEYQLDDWTFCENDILFKMPRERERERERVSTKLQEAIDVMPYLTFPSNWRIKMMPVTRDPKLKLLHYYIRKRSWPVDKDNRVSIILIPVLFDRQKFNWQIYPMENADSGRCSIDDIGGLFKLIRRSLAHIENKRL